MTTVNPKIFGFYERTGDLWWSNYRIHYYQTWNQIRVPYVAKSLIGNDEWQNYENSPENEKKIARPLKGKRILEVGCGGGHLTEGIGLLRPYKVVGIDPVKKNIEIAIQHLNEQEDDDLKDCVSYETILLEDFVLDPKNLDAFDCVIVSETFEHLDYQGVDKIIELSNQVLKKGGSLVVTMISPNFWLKKPYQYVMKRFMTISHADLPDFYALPNEEMQKLMIKNNFKIEHVQGFIFNPLTYTHYFSSFTWFKYGVHAKKI